MSDKSWTNHKSSTDLVKMVTDEILQDINYASAIATLSFGQGMTGYTFWARRWFLILTKMNLLK